MTTPAPTPDTPPERILPTEPGQWIIQLDDLSEIVATVFDGTDWPVPQLMAFANGYTPWRVGIDEDQWEVKWLCRLPTSRELAAVTAQLAAGQALADRVRELDAAQDAPWSDDWKDRHTAAMDAYQDASAVHLSAFPAAEVHVGTSPIDRELTPEERRFVAEVLTKPAGGAR